MHTSNTGSTLTFIAVAPGLLVKHRQRAPFTSPVYQAPLTTLQLRPRPLRLTPQCVSAPPSPTASPTPAPLSPSSSTLNSASAFVTLQAMAASTSQAVYVLFHQKACRSCKAVKPKFESLANVTPNATFATVPLDDYGGRELASRLGVRDVPRVHVYDGSRGKVHDFACAPQSLQRLRDTVASVSGVNIGGDE